jgi:hypothetical protein
MAKKDGYMLERICAGANKKWHCFEIVHTRDFNFQQQHTTALGGFISSCICLHNSLCYYKKKKHW